MASLHYRDPRPVDPPLVIRRLRGRLQPEGDAPVMTDARTPRPAGTGPWSARTCVTAACSRCGAVPVDGDSGLTPHFASRRQAREELTRDWGWHVIARSGPSDPELRRDWNYWLTCYNPRNDWEVLLCPACAAQAPPAATDPGGDQEPGAGPGREGTVSVRIAVLESGTFPYRLPHQAEADDECRG